MNPENVVSEIAVIERHQLLQVELRTIAVTRLDVHQQRFLVARNFEILGHVESAGSYALKIFISLFVAVNLAISASTFICGADIISPVV